MTFVVLPLPKTATFLWRSCGPRPSLDTPRCGQTFRSAAARGRLRSILAAVFIFFTLPVFAKSPWDAWRNGPSTSPSYVPIAVFLQQPADASWFKSIGINLYVGLWNGPTTAQLAQLSAAGMQAIVSQNRVGLDDRSGTVVGWLQIDEPDNAQPDGNGGFGAPVAPEDVIKAYHGIKAADPTRPVLVNFGRGVAWDGWYGRKARTNHPEDYERYVEGADIASFDIYPMASPEAAIHGALWRVGYGVSRLRQWARPGVPVWAVIETGNIGGAGGPTPAQVRAETFAAIANGATGIIYFLHRFKPVLKENGLRLDAEMTASIAATNREITSLARVINAEPSPAPAHLVSDGARIDFMSRNVDGASYLVAVNLDDKASTARIVFDDARGDTVVEAVGEGRRLTAIDGAFADRFEAYQVHVFKMKRGN